MADLAQSAIDKRVAFLGDSDEMLHMISLEWLPDQYVTVAQGEHSRIVVSGDRPRNVSGFGWQGLRSVLKKNSSRVDRRIPAP
jgi:hypothetical protein